LNELARAWANLEYISIGYKSDRGKVAKGYCDSVAQLKNITRTPGWRRPTTTYLNDSGVGAGRVVEKTASA
jgi:hypothetical protein